MSTLENVPFECASCSYLPEGVILRALRFSISESSAHNSFHSEGVCKGPVAEQHAASPPELSAACYIRHFWTDALDALGSCAQVYGLPTLMLFKDGEQVPDSHHEGAISKKSLIEYLERHGLQAE
eukprot:CAMPEP_0177594644 /NCGR_PEP_ID=MMETSP0419_2-20121207/9894_1 /TAXON_ID=582737 /ORGANISM="Tetraselmis sp., Strain GSL018" /LENGTH=124 /DNA_ID=CAMNT_0019085973 /DNA_START=38 /DNA_END=413 /DNA_ORIENTATION=-